MLDTTQNWLDRLLLQDTHPYPRVHTTSQHLNFCKIEAEQLRGREAFWISSSKDISWSGVILMNSWRPAHVRVCVLVAASSMLKNALA